jgi:paraquat-inducible protein B
MASIASQIESIPFERIGRNLDQTLTTVKKTVGSPELRGAIVSLDQALSEARALIQEARSGMRPAFERLPRIAEKLEEAVEQAEGAVGEHGYGPNSTVHRNMERMTNNVAEAARSIRLLADYLSRHPEGLISGRKEASP